MSEENKSVLKDLLGGAVVIGGVLTLIAYLAMTLDRL
jgi:hypothetical protein